MLKQLVSLEEQVKAFKTSQLLGSSSARIIPVYSVDITTTMSMLGWLSFRFTTDKVINPIIMPRVEVRIDGNLVTHDTRDTAEIYYDDYYAAINFYDATGIWKFPDEHMASFTIMVSPYEWNVSHQVTVSGTVYGVAEGNMEYCILG